MKKSKQLIVNLQAARLTKKNLATLHNVIHAALLGMTEESKKTVTDTVDVLPNATRAVTTKPKPLKGKTATLTVEFSNVNAGLSSFTASHNGVEQIINSSDTISFKNVQVNETILIKGNSAGSTNVKLSGVNAIPAEMDFEAGQHINGLFLIIA